MMTRAFEYLADHPELWPYVIIPALGYLLSLVGVPLVKRYPALAPVYEWLLEKLPMLRGAFEKWQQTKRSLPPPMPPPPPPARPGPYSNDPPSGFAMRCGLAFVAAFVFTVATTSTGCAASPEKLTRAVVAGMRLAALADQKLVTAYEREQLDCLKLAESERDTCIKRVRGEWTEIREAYDEASTAACDLLDEPPQECM